MFVSVGSICLAISILVAYVSPVLAFEIIKNNSPACIVAIEKNCSETERFAARELSEHIRLITGVSTDISESQQINRLEMNTIYLGNGAWLDRSPFSQCRNELESEPPESFIIRTFDNIKPAAMIILGKTDRSTLYGVYELLRKIGVRWYTPKITKYPKLDNINLPSMNVIDCPCFEYRGIYPPGKECDQKWETRLRLNSLRGVPESSGAGKVFNERTIYFEELIPLSFYSQNPGVFPLIGDHNVPDQTSRCFTNPESIEIAAAEIEKIISENPGLNVISLCGHGNFDKCLCKKCSSLRKAEKSRNATILFFANSLISKIKSKSPEISIVVDIKRSAASPPQKLRPAKGIYIRLNPDDNDLRVPVDESQETAAKKFLKNIEAWKKVTPNILSENSLCHENYPSLPLPIFKFISGNISMYHYEFVEGCFFSFPDVDGLYIFNGEMYEWLISELLWDRYSDRNALVKEWLKGVYGNAWVPMMEYWQHVQSFGIDYANPIYLISAPETIISEKWLSKSERILQRAYALSLSDSISNSMVKKARTGHLFTRLFFMVNSKKALSIPEKEKGLELLEKWHRDFRAEGYTMVTSNQSGEAFYNKYREALSVK